MTSNFLIGTIKDGLRKDVKPWATPEDSFETMINAYQWRGRILRRPGYTLLGRLNTSTNLPVMGLRTQQLFGLPGSSSWVSLIAFDTQQAYQFTSGTFSALPSVMPVVWSGTNYQFFYTTNYAGAFWATNSKPGINGWEVQSFASESGTGTSATVQVTAAGNTAAVGDFVYFVNLSGGTSEAANNLIYAQVTVINTPNSVFTVRAVTYPPGVNSFTDGSVSTGLVMDSFQAVTGHDGIRYYGLLSNGTGWANYNPPIDPNNVLAGALLIFPYRGYLVFLNTTEGNDAATFNYGNRARWTQVGTPYYSAPQPVFPDIFGIDFLTARDDLFGRGGAVDAPTSEVIVGAEFIRDILVVYFENSTWRLRFVNNSQNPFVWERVNVEFGSDCTFSTIAFDKGLMAIGNRGIVISDGNDTSRFDEKIPDDIFQIRQNNNGLQRVYGIRTFRTKLNYWTFPSILNPLGIYPDYVLVFNYDTKNWSYFDDTFTCFGYYYSSSVGPRWQDLTKTWSNYNNLNAQSAQEAQGYETILAGNQQGFVFKLEQLIPKNDPSLYVSSITISADSTTITSPDHNLKDGMWITLTGTGINGTDGVSLDNRNYQISYLTSNTFTINEFDPINAGTTTLTSFSYLIDYLPILPGSVQINVGTLQFVDSSLDGNLIGSGGTGTINYLTGAVSLSFSPSISATTVYIRVVSVDPEQEIVPVGSTGSYTSGGLIAKISNIDIQTKVFNFFNDDQRCRLSKIDFYMDKTDVGQFTCNVFADGSSVAVNVPLRDNPQSNVVLTSPNPYQIQSGDETIFRLYCDAIAQTVQLQLTLSDQQMAVNAINQEDIEILAMMVSMRRGGRLV
jgi:hypothetical protein